MQLELRLQGIQTRHPHGRRELGVRYLLQGSVRRAARRVRVTAQLVDGATGTQVWANRYDRALADIFDVQDELTDTIIAAIEPELARAERVRARSKRPDNVDARWAHLLPEA